MLDWIRNHDHEKCIKESIVKEVTCKKRDEVKKMNVRFTAVNLGDFEDEDEHNINKIDTVSLGERVWELEPSAIILSYCYSERSKIKEDLIAMGITSSLFIMEDYWKITGKR